jgi:hypothetical protein
MELAASGPRPKAGRAQLGRGSTTARQQARLFAAPVVLERVGVVEAMLGVVDEASTSSSRQRTS